MSTEIENTTIARGLFTATVQLQKIHNTTIAGYILNDETFDRLIVELTSKEFIGKYNPDRPAFLKFYLEDDSEIHVFGQSIITNMDLYDLVASSTDKDEHATTH